MPYQLLYTFRYKDDVTGENIRVNINDTESFTEDPITPTEIELTAGKPACRISVIDNDRTKFKAIRAKQADIIFLPSANLTANTFATGPDDKWFVEVFVESSNFFLFKGYLVMDDHQQSFLPISHKYEVNLVATDNLGTLKEIPLTDFSGAYVRGKDTILNFVLYALGKTNLGLNVVITSTWFEESQTAFESAWENLYLDGKTFENKIGEAVDCYQALEIILGSFLCEITQYNNSWWIGAIDERYGSTVYRFEYQADGTHVANHIGAPFNQTIGKAEDIKFIDKDAVVAFTRPHKFTRLTYNYRFPIEIVDNIDFSRGIDDIVPIVVDMGLYIRPYANLGAFPSTGEFHITYKATDTGNHYRWNGVSYEQLIGAEVPQGIAYVWEDWTPKKGNPDSPNASTSTTYIAKINQYGSEKARYAVLTTPTVATTERSYMESNPIPVEQYDKFTCSVDFRFPTNITNGGAPFYVTMAIRLKGNDGTNWWLGRQIVNGNLTSPKWLNTNSTWTNNSFMPGPAQTLSFNNSFDTREWQQCSWDAPPIPVDGRVYIQLCAMNSQSNTLSTWDDTDIHYANLQFDYIPFINGSYQKYTGHSNTVEQDGNYKANRDEETFLGDSPKQLFKGSIFKSIGGQFVLTERWYKAGDLVNLGITPPIPDEHLKPLGYWQAFAMWNQHNRKFLIISGSLRGLRLDDDVPDMIHSYDINAVSTEVSVTNKSFMLASMESDPETNKWKGTLLETWDSDEPKVYDDTHTFKYEGGAP